MSSEKKCPNCGQWSAWDRDVHATCEHCGALLDEEGRQRQEKKEAEQKRQEENWMFNVKPEDSRWKVGSKKIGYVFYVIFIGIVSALAWIVAALPG